jgi:hypothetical protein
MSDPNAKPSKPSRTLTDDDVVTTRSKSARAVVTVRGGEPQAGSDPDGGGTPIQKPRSTPATDADA